MNRHNPTLKSALLFGALSLGAVAQAADAIRLAPGAATVVQFPENPSTGYSWRIDEDASAGLDHVEIVDGGHTRGASMPGAPGTHRWTIRAVSPGQATVVFDYQRPWEPTPVETRKAMIVIAPQKGK
jgi:inhibitor of cysteine peptidase